MNYQTYPIYDFSRGITDYPFNALPEQSAELDNFLIDPNRKPILRPGSQLYSPLAPRLVPSTVRRVHSLIPVEIENILYGSESTNVYYLNDAATAWAEILGVAGTHAFNAGNVNSLGSFAEWNRHVYGVNDAYSLPIKIFKDGSGVPKVRTAGLPQPDISGTTVTPTAGAGSYIYFFVFQDDYAVDTLTFENLSAPSQIQNLATAPVSGSNPVSITGIPVLANSGGTSYSVSTIKVQIYRTQNGGQSGYLVGSVANGVTTYVDTMTDAVLSTKLPLYTDGGTLPYNQPPLCKYIHVLNGRAYYANLKDSFETYPNRIIHSIQDAPDSVPQQFILDVRDDITGISSYNDTVIVFGTTKIYRVDGYFDELGRNGMTYEEISKVTGCVSHRSIVQTENGVFFAGQAGFFVTDGYKVTKISDSINERYKTAVASASDAARIVGCYDGIERKVYWGLKSKTSSTDNDAIFCLDLRYPVSLASTFTTWTSDPGNFNPTALCIFKTKLFRGDSYGFVYKHDASYTSDPLVDLTIPANTWDTKAIVYNYKSANLNLGFPQVRKWVSKILMTALNVSNLSVQINSINDDSSFASSLKYIRFRNTLIWGDAEPVWSTSTYRWLYYGLIEQMRRFPAGALRCSYKQIQLTNANVNIFGSDAFSTVSIDRTTKIATLSGSLPWPPNLSGYSLAIKPNASAPVGDYPLVLPVVSRLSNSQIQLSDTTNLMNTLYSSPTYNFTNVKWVMTGIPKGEVLNLMGLQLYFAPISPSFKTFYGTQADTGGNA